MTPGSMKLVALITSVLLAAAGFSVYEMQRRPVSSVRVGGELRYTPRSALEDAVATHAATSLYRVDVAAVRDAALSLPWVRDASVRRIWPDSLHIAVIEREPVARWADGGLLERSGVRFVPEASSEFASLPLLAGPRGTQVLVLERYWDVQALLRPLGWEVARLSLNARRAWRIEFGNGVSILMGQQPGLENLQRLVAALERGEPIPRSAFAQIDLRYTNGFSVRWQEGARATEEPG